MQAKHPDHHTLNAHLGKKLREAREFRACNQADLASALGLQRTAIQKIESAEVSIPGATVFRIAETLKVPVQWFYEGLADANGEAPPAVTGESRRLLEAFDRIESNDLRRGLITFMNNLADGLAIEPAKQAAE